MAIYTEQKMIPREDKLDVCVANPPGVDCEDDGTMPHIVRTQSLQGVVQRCSKSFSSVKRLCSLLFK